MLWIKAIHLIAVIAWMAGLFYLPRLFVYHAEATNTIERERFQVMEYKLYYYITWPAGIVSTVFGYWLLYLVWQDVHHAMWMHIKLVAAMLLWIFHLYCGHVLKHYKTEKNPHSGRFFRIINEIPTVLMIIIVICAVVRPHF